MMSILPTTILAQEWLRKIWLTEPGSTTAGTTDSLFLFITWISIVSFIGLMGAMFWFVFRYRRAGGRAPLRSASHNTPLELTWSIGPLMILVVVFFWGFHGYAEKLSSPAGAEEIVVRGYKWGWDVMYDSGGNPTEMVYPGVGDPEDHKVPVIKVPAGEPVRLRMYSSDVIHAFFIPDFRIKRDVMPNRYTSFWFQTLESDPQIVNVPVVDADGKPVMDPDTNTQKVDSHYPRHRVFCAEYCGDSHSQMMAFIEPVPRDVYEQEKIKAANPTFPTLEAHGQWLWQRNCITCHSIDGKPNTGPTWKGIWGETHSFSNAPPTKVDAQYIRESMINPSAKVREGFSNQMNSFVNFTDAEYEAIIAFIKSLGNQADAAPTE